MKNKQTRKYSEITIEQVIDGETVRVRLPNARLIDTWQPIENAPKDTQIICFRSDGTMWVDVLHDLSALNKPDIFKFESYAWKHTHWQPAPSKPEGIEI